MRTPILLIALCVLPTTPETFDAKTVDKKLSTIYKRLGTGQALTIGEEVARGLALPGHGISVESELTLISDQLDGVVEQVETLKNATAQLLGVLSIVRSRQAASSAVQAFMALAFLAYLATIAVCYLVKRCRKHQKEVAKAEFELLEAKLQASRSRRRAAAKEKSAPAQNLE